MTDASGVRIQWPLNVWALTWALFVAIALFYPDSLEGWPNALRGILAVAGASFVFGYLMWPRVLLFRLASISSIALLAIYIADLAVKVSSYAKIDPELGVFATVWLKFSTPYLVYADMARGGEIAKAAVEFYWVSAMPLLQVAILVLLVSVNKQQTKRAGT